MTKDNVRLSEEAGKDAYSSIRPGELWNRALEHAGGHPNLAMSLLGLCGHDDAQTDQLQIVVSNAKLKSIKDEVSGSWDKILSAYSQWSQALQVTRDIDPSKVIEAVAKFTAKNEDHIKLICWATGIHFVPKSLGQDVDLPQAFKEKLAKIQAPSKGAAALPAKAYHFVGSALTACEFIGKSRLGYASVLTNPLAAYAYRGKRIIDQASFGLTSDSSGRAKLITVQGYDPSKATVQLVSEMLSRSREFKLCIPDENGSRSSTIDIPAPPGHEDAEVCLSKTHELSQGPNGKLWDDFLSCAPNPAKFRDATPIQSCMLRRARRRDAAYLANKWFQFLEIPGVGPILLPTRSNRAEIEDHVDTLRAARGIPRPPGGEPKKPDHECDEPGWSEERCKNALSMLETWEIDFEWTLRQHLIGARFAMQNCRPLKRSESIETLACEALKKRSGSTQARPTTANSPRGVE